MSAYQIPIFDDASTINMFQHRLTPDFRARNEGSIWLLFADTDAARCWEYEYLPREATKWGNATVIECRYVEEVVRGIIDSGLTVMGE